MLTNKTTLIAAAMLYLISTASSFAAFAFLSTGGAVSKPTQEPSSALGGLLDIDPGEPKDQVCPLNGAYYTKTEQIAWSQRRPLAIMVENSPDARPHSGLVKADIVYEAVAEGGVTRFMPIYFCDAQAFDVTVAPVRSVRSYFIDWASEYGEFPLFANVGGANCSAEKLPSGAYGPCKSDPRTQAIEQLTKYQWRYSTGNNLDQFSIGAPTFIRKPERTGRTVATEHSVVTTTEGLWEVAFDRGWTNLSPKGDDWYDAFTEWKFDDAPPTPGAISAISYDFWQGYKQYDARWEYDSMTNTYKRFTGGEPHLDLETGQQIAVSNVIVIKTKEEVSVDELNHNLYETIGDGEALVFKNGEVIESFWDKPSRIDRTIFTTKKGEILPLARGKVWISVVSLNNEVAY